jgi:ribose transport system permease protein
MPSEPGRTDPAPRRFPLRLTTPVVVLLTVAALWVFLGVRKPVFVSGENVQFIMLQMAIQGVIGVGAVLVILTGGIDLSVGSMVGFINVLFAMLVTKDMGLPIPVALLIVLPAAAALGLVNGVMVHDVRLPPFVATLGMMTILRGTTLLVTEGRNVFNLPVSLSRFAQSAFLGIPSLFWILIAVVVLAEVVLRRTTFGRYVYALGSNREAARLTGVNTRLVTYGVYMLGGLLGGIAGAMETSRLWMGVPTTGNMYELDAIAAAVLGGASLAGAEGTAWGAFIGALLMATIYNGAVLLEVDSNLTKVIVGVILIATVAVDQLRKRRSGE